MRLGARWFRLRRDRATREAEVRDEVDAHIALAIGHLVARGVPRDVAEREARARFGNFDVALARMYSSAQERDVRLQRRDWLDELAQDARLAVRQWKRAPRFFAAAVLTLALGVGANGVVFSILQSTLLQSLPYGHADQLAMLGRVYSKPPAPPPGTRRLPRRLGMLTSPTILAWRERMNADVADLAAMITWQGDLEAQFDLATNDRTQRFNGAFVTPNFLDVLQVRPAIGRGFDSTDVATSAQPIVISQALWQREFGADRAIVGRSVTLTAGRPREPHAYTVVGVLPADVHFTYPEETEVWAMMSWADVARYSPTTLAFRAVLRAREGLSVAAVQQRALLVRDGIERPNAPPEYREELRVQPMHDWVVGEVQPSLQLLGGVALLLLLITCVTVASGLLARVSERKQELAVRAALGAGRGRLIRQLVTEGAMLSVMGALAGTLLAITLLPVLRVLLPATLPLVGDVAISARIIAFGAFAATLSTIFAATAPALGGTHGDPTSHIARGAGPGSASADRTTVRWRQSLLGAQAAIATSLLITAALLLTSFWKLRHVETGFEGDRVITVEMRLIGAKYRPAEVVRRFQDDVIARVRAIPGVTEAGLTSAVPLRGVDFTQVFGRPGEKKEYVAQGRYVDSGYFRVLRIPLVRGRFLSDADRDTLQPVAVLSESFARSAFGDEDPLGRQILYDKPIEVVGIVRDVRYAALENDPRPAVYLSRAQSPSTLMCVVVRASVGFAEVTAAIRRAVHEADPTVPTMKSTTIDRIVDESVADRRFYTTATASFATLALLLTIAGLAAVVARVVAERRRELAIRAALGATVPMLARVAVRDAFFAICVGVAIGVFAVYAGAATLSQFLFQVAPRSPATFVSVPLLVIATALIAAWVPVRRLGQVSLSAILRAD